MLEKLGDASGASTIRFRSVGHHNRFALGAVSLGILSKSTEPAAQRSGDLLCVLDGELYDTHQVCARLREQGHDLATDDHAGILLAQFNAGGPDSLAKLEGSFAAAIVDRQAESLTLISDAFGSRPLYYAQLPDRIVFASRIAAMLVDQDLSRGLDWSGLSQFFTFGHYFNGETSLRDVKVLPAGAVYQYDGRTNRAKVQHYWTSSDAPRTPIANRNSALEAVDEALVEAVRRRTIAGGANLGLALSGGLDARTILGLIEHPADRLKTVCLGMAGSRDHIASSRLAAIVGCSHHSHLLDDGFLGDFRSHLEAMVGLTDGQYLSQCIVMPTLPLYRDLGVEVLLRGHGGELLHMSKAYNYSLDSEALQLRDEAGLENWLWKRLQAYLLDGVDGPLFADAGIKRSELARESLRAAISHTPADVLPAQRVAHLFLHQRVRRETPLSLMKFRSVVEPRVPYMDRRLVDVLFSMPVEWRLDDELQGYILRKRQPRFCHVENTNTGSVLGAGKLRRTVAGVRMRVGSKLGLPGYQPYERLGLWLRRELAPLVSDVLLDEACLDGGVFAPGTVRQVVERHLSGARNHTYLIMAMMVFEVGHRQLFGERLFNQDADTRQPLTI
jgi:asparagine synthase (glutamine-hydrolysing)